MIAVVAASAAARAIANGKAAIVERLPLDGQSAVDGFPICVDLQLAARVRRI